MKGRLVAGFLTLAASLALAESAPRFVREHLPWGRALSLTEFGGPPIEVSVRSRQMTFVSVEIADYTRMVPVLVNDLYYSGYGNRITMQPSRETRRIEKKNGIPFPGSRSDMFPLFQEPASGIRIYFLDEVVGQNRDALVIQTPGPPPPAQPVRNPHPKAESPPARAHQDGYLSDELLAWYLRLQTARESLDLNDRSAVARFNEEAARYHAAVKRERAAASRR